MNSMKSRVYDERVIEVYYVPREIYYENYKKGMAMPIVKAPIKEKKDLTSILPQSKSAHIAVSRGVQ